MYSEETELAALIRNGLAENLTQATRMLEEAKTKKKRADMLIFYLDANKVRAYLGKYLIDEQHYNFSQIRVAKVASGVMSKLKNCSFSDGSMVFGKIIELVSKPKVRAGKRDARLGVIIKNFPYQDKDGIFFSPYSAKAVRARGSMTIDERENLFRIESRRAGGDFVLGMFSAWKKQPISETTALVLYLPKASAIFI